MVVQAAAATSPPMEHETRRELAKLTATFMNGVAGAIIAVGGLAPIVAYMLDARSETSSLVLAVMSPIFALIGLGLHVAARQVLRRGIRQ